MEESECQASGCVSKGIAKLLAMQFWSLHAVLTRVSEKLRLNYIMYTKVQERLSKDMN